MVRKPSVSKIGENAHMPANTNQSSERMDSQPGSSNPSLQRAELKVKDVNPSLGSLELQPETISPSLVGANTPHEQQAKSAKPSNPRKRKTHQTGVVRRSERIYNVVMPTQSLDVEPMVEESTPSEREKENDLPAWKEQNLPEPVTSIEKNFEEKFNNIVQQLEAQEKAMEALKSEVTKKSFLSGSPSKSDMRYKNLYLDSQKKVDFLTEENKRLAMKLETALSKLEAYQSGNHVFSEVFEKLKDVILISNLTKATETAVNFTSQAFRNASSPGDVLGCKGSAAKRKKPTVTQK